MTYFQPEEFFCKCGRGECDAVPMRPIFLAKLNLLRQLWGAPLVVTSGRRCAYWNKEVGGAERSEHLHGNAADIAVSGRIEADQLSELADKVGFGGIGIAKHFVHVDDGPPNRRWGYP